MVRNIVMGSIGMDTEKKDMVVTQLSFGGFGENVSAKELTDFLEREVGIIWRCRLKNSSTPRDSYPCFDVGNTSKGRRSDDYEKVVPHAFVHFASPKAVKIAVEAAGSCELVFGEKPLLVNLGPQNTYRMSHKRTTITPFKFRDARIDIGSVVSRHQFLSGWKGPISGADFIVDPFDGCCKIMFTMDTTFSFRGMAKHTVIKCDFKVEFFAKEITAVKLYQETDSLIMLFQLASSSCISYRTADDDIHVSVPFVLLDDDDPWIRTTDFTPGGAIGRCNSYKFSLSPRFGPNLLRAVDYLKEWRITVDDYRTDCLRQKLKLQVQDEPDYGMPMSDSFFCIQYEKGIDFETTFLVNAAMHKGIINQHQLSEKFFELLRCQKNEVNVAALKHICSYRRPLFDACKRLKLVQEWIMKNPKLLASPKSSDDNVEVRRLVITPTKAHCLPPEVELSNRVLRKFKEVQDRFLRVTFMDEGMRQLNSNVLTFYSSPIVRDITKNSYPQRTNVFRRVKTILSDGFYLCGRKYSFLAFSSNQLRDRSAWFYADSKNISVNDIKSWMGKFTDRNIAKYAARMGLCFSSTYATVEVPMKEVNTKLPDIIRNDYVFSDGIGMLTPDLAREVAAKLQLSASPPCAYQIRFAGCKGVIACWPGKNDGIRLSLRPSMIKFLSQHTVLEIVSWTRFQPGFLNRQIVTLLSALGVPDVTFSRMQDSMVHRLDQILVNTDVAFEILTSSCAEQGNTAAMMLSAGFNPQMEPHLKGMLSSIRAAQLGDLLGKARIFVPQGRWLMGCLDELGLLEHGQCFIQVSTPSLENCFSKHGTEFSDTTNTQVIKGIVAIAKNPCLHPGDIRILEAIDAPDLHHLVDCLVFPQKGDRPHTNEASGSDLDGDLYFVTWDKDLIPPSKSSWPPMDYTPAEAAKLSRPVLPADIIEFFTKNMVNETLGTICNAHVVHSDLSDYGALDEKCIQLADLAAKAVDFPKTGVLVSMPQSLKPKVYPDFMGKGEYQTYKSKKVLGKLYRKVKDMSDGEILSSSELPCAPEDIPFDKDLEIPGSADFILDAWKCKCSYDGQLSALLGQFKVNTEEEIVTGHVWSMPKYSSRKQGQLKEKLKDAYHGLKKEFKHIFENLGQVSEQLTKEEKNTLYEQKASAWYQVSYHPRWVRKSLEIKAAPDGDEAAPVMLSFAWIPAEYLVRIKVRSRGTKNLDIRKPINSLANYLAHRI